MAIIQLAPAKNSDPQGNMSTFPGKIAGLLSTDEKTASEVVSGPDAGMLLSAYIDQKGWGCLGTKAEGYKKLPINVKLITSQNDGLISVNPHEGKEAVWYVTEAPEGAKIEFGLAKEMTIEEFQAALKDGSIAGKLQVCPTAVGDVFDIKAGTIFALGDDVQILDMQKNTLQPDFNVEEIFQSLILKPVSHNIHENEWLADGSAQYECIGKNNVFEADLFQLNGRMDMDANGESFKGIFFVEGTAVIDTDGGDTLHAMKNSAFFVEAGTYPFHITGNCQFIVVTLV